MMLSLQSVCNILNFFDDSLRSNTVPFVVFGLNGATAGSLVDGPLHRACHGVGIENHFAQDVSGRAADNLDERSLAPEKTFFVGVENAGEGYFRQVEAFSQQIDADQAVALPAAKRGQN